MSKESRGFRNHQMHRSDLKLLNYKVSHWPCSPSQWLATIDQREATARHVITREMGRVIGIIKW
jgi:hypothetical protein